MAAISAPSPLLSSKSQNADKSSSAGRAAAGASALSLLTGSDSARAPSRVNAAPVRRAGRCPGIFGSSTGSNPVAVVRRRSLGRCARGKGFPSARRKKLPSIGKFVRPSNGGTEIAAICVDASRRQPLPAIDTFTRRGTTSRATTVCRGTISILPVPGALETLDSGTDSQQNGTRVCRACSWSRNSTTAALYTGSGPAAGRAGAACTRGPIDRFPAMIAMCPPARASAIRCVRWSTGCVSASRCIANCCSSAKE